MASRIEQNLRVRMTRSRRAGVARMNRTWVPPAAERCRHLDVKAHEVCPTTKRATERWGEKPPATAVGMSTTT